MKNLKKAILVILLIIVVIIVMIVMLSKKKSGIENNEESPIVEVESVEDTEETEDKIQRLEYNIINSTINIYIQSLNQKNSAYYTTDESGSLVSILTEEQKKEKIIDLLSENYIKSNEITVNNLSEKIQLNDEQLVFVPIAMKKINAEDVMTYVVQGITEDLSYQMKQEICLIVNIDYTNMTFSIEPTNKEYNDVSIVQKLTKIEKNENNQYNNVTTTAEDIVREDINWYKRLALAKPELAYSFLDEEYRNTRFGSLENYEKYIEKNKQTIVSLPGAKYLVNNYDGYTQYVCQDKYENSYIFNEKAPMDFTLQLDTYTIPTEKFTTTYTSSSNQKKVMMNVDKWVQMLNNRDYTSAYNLLDETYRNNTFGSEEQFETTMREKLPLHYKVEYSNFSEEKETYMQDITLTDITEEEEGSVQISVIMQLKEELDFVMSFSFQE